MSDDEESLFTKEQELCDIYYNPVKGYQSAQKLYETAPEEGLIQSNDPKT